MAWDIEYTDEFAGWWETLIEEAQIDVDAIVGLLQECGPNLPFPYSSGVAGSRHSHLRNPFYLDTESGSDWTPKRENSHLPFSGSLVSSSGQF